MCRREFSRTSLFSPPSPLRLSQWKPDHCNRDRRRHAFQNHTIHVGKWLFFGGRCTTSEILKHVLQRGAAEKGFATDKHLYTKKNRKSLFPFWLVRTNMEGGGSGRGTTIYTYICGYWFACWFESLRCCARAIFWLALVLWGASRSARKKASCARPHWRKLRVRGLAAGRLFSRYSPIRVLRFIALGKREGQKYGFRPRCTGRAPERSPKQKTPVLASQAFASNSFSSILQVRPARKLRLTDPKCTSAASQISLTRLKLPKIAVFVTNSLQRAFSRNWPRQPTCRPKPKASFAREYWLRNVAALACCFAPQGHFLGLETGTYGHHSVRAGALDAQIGAQNPQLVGSQAPRPL